MQLSSSRHHPDTKASVTKRLFFVLLNILNVTDIVEISTLLVLIVTLRISHDPTFHHMQSFAHMQVRKPAAISSPFHMWLAYHFLYK